MKINKDKAITRIKTFFISFFMSFIGIMLCRWFINGDRPDSQLIWYFAQAVIPSLMVAIAVVIYSGGKSRRENQLKD